jgi:flavin reductase (DIM6/NTAB) family NADH-FMN oxidoreductase RutF
MSSAFWLEWRCILGLAASSKTTENLKRTRECVLNLPSDEQAHAVDRLALTTGSHPVPPGKVARGYRPQNSGCDYTTPSFHTAWAQRRRRLLGLPEVECRKVRLTSV